MAPTMTGPQAFRMSTRRNRIPMADILFTQAGQFNGVDVPQVGYAAAIILQLYGKIVTGTGTAGAWSNYFPSNLLQNIAFRSNEGLEVYRTSGYANFLINQIYHLANTFAGNSATAYNTSNKGMRTAIAIAPSSGNPGSNLADSTTYPVMVTYRIPICADDRLSSGLILLQNQATRARLEMQVNNLIGNGGINGILNATGNLGVGATIALTARSSMEFFAVPPDPNAQPDTTFIHRWIEESQLWSASGDFVYNVPVNGIISRVIFDIENNGAPQPWFSTASDPTTQNGTNVRTIYAASTQPEIEDIKIALARQRWDYSSDLPDGAYVFEYSKGGGSVELGWDGRDTYDTSALTQFQTSFNLNITPTAGKVRCIRQELQRRAR